MRVEDLSPERIEEIRRYQELDNRVFQLLESDAYDFYTGAIKESAQAPIRQTRDAQEKMILYKDLDIAALRKENNRIWEIYVENMAEERLKVRSLEEKLKRLQEAE